MSMRQFFWFVCSFSWKQRTTLGKILQKNKIITLDLHNRFTPGRFRISTKTMKKKGDSVHKHN